MAFVAAVWRGRVDEGGTRRPCLTSRSGSSPSLASPRSSSRSGSRATSCPATEGPQEMQEVGGTILEGANAFIKRQYTTIAILAVVGAFVVAGIIAWVETEEVAETPIFGLELGIMTGIAFLVGATASMVSGHHRHVGERARQRAHRGGGAHQPRRGRPGGHARRRRVRLPGGGPLAAGRVGHLRGLRGPVRGSHLRHRPVPHRRLRLRRLLRGPLRAARRRHLHQGRRRRCGPRGQGREGHPRGRPAQRGRHRRPRRRQRRRLRRPRRRPLRVHGRREHRRHDPGRRPSTSSPSAAGWPNPEAWIFFPLVVRAFGLLRHHRRPSTSSAAARTRTP